MTRVIFQIFLLTCCGCPVPGFVIVGEDNTGKLDLGIFVASIVPDGPAGRDGRIKPGKYLHHSKKKMKT